ncbi:MAG: NUDIX domain-containing protein [Phycisphaerales bacterium]
MKQSTSPTPRLAPRAMIMDGDGRTLLLRRTQSSRHWPGQWELPGGKPEPGEDWHAALERETLEETGLRIRCEGLVGAAEWLLQGAAGGAPILLIVLVLRCRVVEPGGPAVLSDEHDEAVWAETERLRSLAIVEPHRRGMGLPPRA